MYDIIIINKQRVQEDMIDSTIINEATHALIFSQLYLTQDELTKAFTHQQNELLSDISSSMISINHYESGYYHVVLEKKPVYRVIENQITEVSPTKILICKFNLKETICTHP